VPLNGRYHDGPQRCVVGYDPDGKPIYSGLKVERGNCSGFLEIYYSRETDYYKSFMVDPLQPVTVLTAETAAGRKAIAEVHSSLLGFHKDALAEVGVTSLPPPKTIVISNWTPDGAVTPGIGSMQEGPAYSYEMGYPAKASVRHPAPDYDVFVADQDYGYRSGWAVGSLVMAEKVLQAELGVPKPTWLEQAWYDDNVMDIKEEAEGADGITASRRNSDFKYAFDEL